MRTWEWCVAAIWRHHPGSRMAVVLEAHRDFLFVSSIQEVRGPQRMVFLCLQMKMEAARCVFLWGETICMHKCAWKSANAIKCLLYVTSPNHPDHRADLLTLRNRQDKCTSYWTIFVFRLVCYYNSDVLGFGLLQGFLCLDLLIKQVVLKYLLGALVYVHVSGRTV